jgi:TonB family protein
MPSAREAARLKFRDTGRRPRSFRLSAREDKTTKKIGKYEILRELGRGAMGVVFKARDPLIGRLVALKTIALAASQSEDLRQRFFREAQAAGGLQHPNIVTVYEMGEEEGVPFIAMEYLEGENLDAVLASNSRIPLAQKLGYLVQVCRALSYAHQHGVVHRDIKPGNIVVTRDGTVKVVDFGIARMMDSSKTQTGVLLGTLAYMSPQLVKGERADERSDIWAVGVVSYELFAGGLKPFDGENHAALLMSIVSDEPRPLAKLAADCPEELRAIVEKMLRKKTEERYQSFEELLRTLEPIWRRYQREWVDFMLAESRDLLRKGELSSARKVLISARLVDGTRTLTRELLEKVNAALKDKLIPAEIEEHLERARSFRSEGLFEEALSAAKSALDLDSRSQPALQMASEIKREMELFQETKKGQRAPALERLLTAMRAAIQQGNSAEAIRIGREALGRAGHDTRVSELMELAEGRLRQERPRTAHGEPGDVKIELYPKADDSEQLIREYVFERVAPQSERSAGSLPLVDARAVEVTQRSSTSTLRSSSESGARSLEGSVEKQTGRRSGTMVLGQPAEVPHVRAAWKKPLVYASLAAVAAATAVVSFEWNRLHPKAAPVQVTTAPGNLSAVEDRPKVPASPPPRDTLEITAPPKAEDEPLINQAQQLARNGDSGNLRQAQHLLDRVIAMNGAHRTEAERLRDSISQRLSKSEQDLQRNEQFSTLAAEARRDLDAGDAAAARGKLSEIQKLGGKDENLAAEIDRTERARFAFLESEYQQDAQSADERARSHLGDLQRQFRALAANGGPLADNARNYSENLIPAKIAEIETKTAAASKNTASADQEFDNAVRDYKKFLEAHDTNSLKTLALPKFQAIINGGGAHSAQARQYADTLIPAALRQLAPFPAIGCAEVPAGLRPSVKAGDLVACGLLDEPRLKWVQFSWPEFPPRAKQAGQAKGLAMLTLTVDESGGVLEANPRGRSDAYGFIDAAVQAARSWKTNPPRVQGKPVRTQFSVDVSFSIN